MEITYSIDQLSAAVAQFWEQHEEARVFAFQAEMGAGKTTFINELCIYLGVEGSVKSPSFSIINEYLAGETTIFHLDLYRLKDEEEARNAGVESCIQSGDICFVEWPERAPAIFPAFTKLVRMQIINPNTRKIWFDKLETLPGWL